MISLKDQAKYGKKNTKITLIERLPHFVQGPCEVDLSYEIEAREDFYLVDLDVKATLQIQCQRCLDEFIYPYTNHTQIAVCADDIRAEALLEQYECIVSPSFEVGLEDLVTDELYLYAPPIHPEITECNSQINQFLAENNESH